MVHQKRSKLDNCSQPISESDDINSESLPAKDDDYNCDSDDNSASHDMDVSQPHVNEISTNELLKTLKRKLSKSKRSEDDNIKMKWSESIELDNDVMINQVLRDIIQRDQIINSLKKKLNIHHNIGDQNFKVNNSSSSFADMLKSSVGDLLPSDVQDKICHLLCNHFGKEDEIFEDKAKKLLIDVLLLLADCSSNYPTQPTTHENSGIEPDHEPVEENNDDVNQAVQKNNNFTSSPKGNSKTVLDDDKLPIPNEEFNPVNKSTILNSSEEIKHINIDEIMTKLNKTGHVPINPPDETEKNSALTARNNQVFHDQPSFKIWGSDDDLHHENDDFKKEITTAHLADSYQVIPDSYSPNHVLRNKITPRKLSQTFAAAVESLIICSDSPDKMYMVTLENSTSPNASLNENKENEKGCHIIKDSPDVVFIGEKKFSKKCADIGNKTNMMYNKMNRIMLDSQKQNFKTFASPERVLLCNMKNFNPSTSGTKPIHHDLRRLFFPILYKRHWFVFIVHLKDEIHPILHLLGIPSWKNIKSILMLSKLYIHQYLAKIIFAARHVAHRVTLTSTPWRLSPLRVPLATTPLIASSRHSAVHCCASRHSAEWRSSLSLLVLPSPSVFAVPPYHLVGCRRVTKPPRLSSPMVVASPLTADDRCLASLPCLSWPSVISPVYHNTIHRWSHEVVLGQLQSSDLTS
ncbi:Os08g0429600 [Oryza sativa Japonica Group]|uniref:Os08g0429600 protein n=1 Tax=Oryza sativa subsp. japonica TaxID=39947 RepID=A0A0P0XFW9_ORYSJ|nr:Os08g0429600 [Oryza sativa Japonica Group]